MVGQLGITLEGNCVACWIDSIPRLIAIIKSTRK